MPLPASAAEGLNIGWTNNFLTISGRQVPGDFIRINYLEAFAAAVPHIAMEAKPSFPT